MATASASSVRTRRTASRLADAQAGERAHMLIWRSGRTQGDIALEIGIEPTAFGKKLRGKNGWALQELIDLAAVLNTSVGYLVGETDGDDPDTNLRTTDYHAVVTDLGAHRAKRLSA